MRPLEDPGDLLADALERAAYGRLGRARGLQLGDELAGLSDVRVDGDPVIAPQGDRKVHVGSLRHRVGGERLQRRGDLLHEGVLGGS